MLLLLALAHAGEPVTLTLDEALARLDRDAPDLARVRARSEGARAVVRQSAAAALPVWLASGGFVKNDEGVELSFADMIRSTGLPIDTSGFPGPITLQPESSWTASTTLRVPLVAPVAWADTVSASRNADAAEASLGAARLDLQTALVQAAASTDAAAGFVGAAERGLALAERHRDSSARAVAAGTEGRLALLQAEADVAQRQSDLVAARADLDGAREAMGTLLGIDGPVIVVLPDLTLPEASQPAPAVRAAEASLSAARAQVTSGWLRQAPTVSAYGTAIASTTAFPTGRDTAWKVGVDLTWTLYDGGFRYGRLRQARADRDAAEAFLQSQQLAASRAVRDAERARGVAEQRLALAERQQALAAEAARIADDGLAAGLVGEVEARDSETRAYLADVQLAAAKARVVSTAAALRRARGAAW